MVRKLVIASPSMAVPHYLMASYQYYVKDDPYLSDGCYDWLCKFLLEHWCEIEHWHKHLIDRKALLAGTGFYLKEYPQRVKFAAQLFMKDF